MKEYGKKNIYKAGMQRCINAYIHGNKENITRQTAKELNDEAGSSPTWVLKYLKIMMY